MSDIIYFILFAAGLIMVVKGSDWFVDSAVWTAEVFRIPSIIIGVTIISICTTLPETFVSAAAAMKGEAGMAIGNALGSIGVNTGLILAILLLSAHSKIEDRDEFLKNSTFLISLLVILWITGFFFGEIGRPAGAGLLVLFLLHMIRIFLAARKKMDLDIDYDVVSGESFSENIDLHNTMPEGMAYDKKENDYDLSLPIIIKKIVFFLLGIFLVIFGSSLLVDNGIHIAEIFHVPNFLIAVIFTSIGTSLPEMVTVITSIRKGAANLGIGNVIGASILNIVQVISISALLLPIPMTGEKSILMFQLPLLIIIVLSLICFGIFSKDKLSRRGGVWLLVLYIIFLTVNIFRGSAPILGPILF